MKSSRFKSNLLSCLSLSSFFYRPEAKKSLKRSRDISPEADQFFLPAGIALARQISGPPTMEKREIIRQNAAYAASGAGKNLKNLPDKPSNKIGPRT
jgi:hypothetical protein